MIRQSALNLAGGLLPAFVALACTPLTLLSHGSVFFGIYSLQTALVVVVGLMDLGISRGITLATFDAQLNPDADPARPFKAGLQLSVAVALAVSMITLLGAAVFFEIRPASADVMLSTSLHIASGALTILTLPFRALFEIQGRFGRLNAIRSLLACSVPIAPLLPSALDGLLLTNAAAIVLLLRVLGLAAYALSSGIGRARLRAIPSVDRAWRREFMHRCGWAGLTNLVSLVLTYADRFLLGSIGAVTEVSHFVVAQEAATKIWMVTGAVQSATTPRVAMELHAARDADDAQPRPALRRTKLILSLTVVLPSLVLVLYNERVFRLWLRSGFTPAISQAASILIAGIAVNSMSQLNFTLLQLNKGEAQGARLQFVNLGLAALFMAVLVPPLGALGAAIAFSLRLAIDAFITRHLTTRQSRRRDGFTHAELAATLLLFLLIIGYRHASA
jgi:O-antigen/teichoic acid export membrane protein